MSHSLGLSILFVLVASVPAFAVEPIDTEARDRRTLEIIQTRLEPQQRERALKVWNDSAERPDVRAQLATAFEQFETKMKPDWTGLSIGGGVSGLAAGIGAGVLAAKLGAAGMVAGPIGVVAGIATGALIAYSIHKYHQRKALEGGVFSRTGRTMGFKGKGLEGDLLKAEEKLRQPRPPPPGAQPAQPARRHWWSLRRTPAAPQAPTPPRAPTTPATPAPPPATTQGIAPRDDLNTDDIRNTR